MKFFQGNFVAVGTHRGYVQVWDVMANKRVNVLEGHTARVGALAWNGDNLSSGSRDRMIRQRDVRTPPLASERCLGSHRQEVCGLKWSPDNQYLASGGNDNKLFVWNTSSTQPVHAFTEHLAAVKAIAWSPHHHGLLASGGGTADRCIRFWNTLTGQVRFIFVIKKICQIKTFTQHTEKRPRRPRTTHMTHRSKGAKFIIRTKSTLWVLFQLTEKEPTVNGVT